MPKIEVIITQISNSVKNYSSPAEILLSGIHLEGVGFTVLNCRENNNSTAKLEYRLFSGRV